MKLLSILICSLSWRNKDLNSLLKILNPQLKAAGYDRVELLVYIDVKGISTGAKRNLLLNQATGKYIVFIDNDDWVPHYYVKEMLAACEKDADCIAINGYMTTDGRNSIKWRLSKNFDNVTIFENNTPVYLRKTNHITAVKREHAMKVMFPDKSNAEDKAYSEPLIRHLKTEVEILPVMYHYRFSSHNKEYI